MTQPLSRGVSACYRWHYYIPAVNVPAIASISAVAAVSVAPHECGRHCPPLQSVARFLFPVLVVDAFSQYWARSWFPPLPLCSDKEKSDPRRLIWLSPAVPRSLCSCAIAPMLKAAKAIATAAATFASIDNFIQRIAR